MFIMIMEKCLGSPNGQYLARNGVIIVLLGLDVKQNCLCLISSTGVALLSNAPERPPDRRKRAKELMEVSQMNVTICDIET